LIYSGGSVKYMNSGYELNSLYQGGFLYGGSYYISVEISNVEFSFNLLQFSRIEDDFSNFIHLDSWNSFYTLKKCIFKNNYTSTSLIFIRQKITQSPSIKNSDVGNGFKLINITFINNSSRYGILRYIDSSIITNIAISSVTFDRCVSSEEAMINIQKAGLNFDGLTYGEYIDLNKDLYNLRIQNFTITECYSGVNFINITNILHTTFDGLTLENSADSNESIDDLVNEFTLNDFKYLEDIGIEKGNIYQYKMESIGFISMNYLDTISIKNSLFMGNRWKTNSLLNIKNTGFVVMCMLMW
jgi:hypothetical protein